VPDLSTVSRQKHSAATPCTTSPGVSLDGLDTSSAAIEPSSITVEADHSRDQ
jgi:hypothetical protein